MRTSAKAMRQRRAAEDALVMQALAVLEERLAYEKPALGSPQMVRDFLRLRLGLYEREAFLALWLDSQNRLIEVEELFRGTLTATAVYPREVVKSALRANAGAVVFAHNHPSGCAKPSTADVTLTANLKQSLGLVDVLVLDHMVVTACSVTSMAEIGKL